MPVKAWGISGLWTRTLEAFVLKDGQWSLIASLAEADPVYVWPFEAISFPLSNLWT